MRNISNNTKPNLEISKRCISLNLNSSNFPNSSNESENILYSRNDTKPNLKKKRETSLRKNQNQNHLGISERYKIPRFKLAEVSPTYFIQSISHFVQRYGAMWIQKRKEKKKRKILIARRDPFPFTRETRPIFATEWALSASRRWYHYHRARCISRYSFNYCRSVPSACLCIE